PVAAIRRTEQREERLVLVDGQELAVAERPPLRREVEAHDPDLGQEGLCHPHAPLGSGPAQRRVVVLCLARRRSSESRTATAALSSLGLATVRSAATATKFEPARR